MPEGRAIGSAVIMVVGEIISAWWPPEHEPHQPCEGTTSAISTLYNVRIRERTVLPGLPAPHDHTGKGQNGNMLYILGGRLQGHWNVVDTVFEYNLHSYYWSTDFASMLTSCTRCVSTTIRLKMFIAGDEGDPDTYTNV